MAELCPNVLPNVRVPELVANDYLVRLTAEALSGQNPARSSGTVLGPHYSNFTQPPSVLHLPEGGLSSFGAACGLGMNAVFEVVSGAFDAVMYNTQATSSRVAPLNPLFGTSAWSLHRFTWSPSATWSPFEAFGAASIKPLDQGSRLFVPPSTLVALRGASAGGGLAFKYCFVDASNLNAVKEHAAFNFVHFHREAG